MTSIVSMGATQEEALSREDIDKIQQRKAELLKLSSSRRRTYLDNEVGESGGLTGLFSVFFSKTAFKHGWETEENNHRDRLNQIIPENDPSSKIYAFSMVSNIVVGVVFSAVIAGVVAASPAGLAGLSVGVAVAIGAAAGVAIGGLCGLVDGYLETGKIKREISEGREAAKSAVKEVKQEKRQRGLEAKSDDMEKRFAELEAKLAQTQGGKKSHVEQYLEQKNAPGKSVNLTYMQ